MNEKVIFNKFKKEFEDNPITVIGVSAILISAFAKFIDAMSAAKGRRAYARQVDYRIRNKRRK